VIKLVLPLYANNEAPTAYQPGANAGLWYNKFCSLWQDWELNTRKKDWVNSVTAGAENRLVGDKELLDAMVARLSALVSSLGGVLHHYKNVSRFVTGLGYNHPVENGFAWHHTLGVPVLPGSALKGAVRAWAEDWASEGDQETIERIFGSQNEGPHKVGSIIFFDALPAKPVRLEGDVLTPHYGPYYRDPDKTTPGDWYSPNPIPFLTVATGQVFVFAFAPRKKNGAAEQPDVKLSDDVRLVGKWLDEMLTWLGVGAKTAIGYGRFTRVPPEGRKK